MIDQLKKQLKSGEFSFKKIIAILIMAAITVVFVFFGMMGKDNAIGGGVGYAARVNNNIISLADLNTEASRLEQMYAPMFGGNLSGDMRERMTMQALENLISIELIHQGALKEGILVADEEVKDLIVNEIPAFKKDGRFSRDLYQRVLQANNYSTNSFEQRIRRDKVQSKTRALIESVAQTTALEKAKEASLSGLQLNVAFIKWSHEDLAKKYAAENKVDNKLVEEKLKSDYATKEGQQKIEAYYQSHQAEYVQDEKVRASHILIKVDPKKPESDKQALEKINKIKERLAKEDFGKVAAEVSEDKGSAAKKGDLDFFSKGQMVPEFEQAAFSQKVGVIGAPVKSGFGYHIIKVTDKKAKVEVTLESAKAGIVKRLLADAVLEEDLKKLEEALSKSDAVTVEALVKKMGLKWEETGYFGLDVDAIPKLTLPTLTQAVFELSKEKPLLPRLVRETNDKYMLKWVDLKKVDTALVKNTDEDKVFASAGKPNDSKAFQYFGDWVESLKTSAEVERNNSIFRRN